ncbi:hypothetical protein CL647_02040 [bacterium]|nr:hypothetical protein [bacterium]
MSLSYKSPLILTTTNLFFVCSFSIVKFLSSTVAIETIMLFRFLAGPVFLIPFFILTKKPIIIKSYSLFIFRIFFGISAMSCLFLSFKYGQIGKSMLIFECSTIWTLILSYIFYKNKPHYISLLTIPFVFIGLYLVLQPQSMTTFNQGDLFALLGSFFNTGVYITLKQLRYSHDTTTIVLICYFFSALIVSIPAIISPPMISLETIGYLILMCSVGFLGQLGMTLGFKFASAGICSLLMLSIVPLTTLSGILFFGESYQALVWLGLILIFSCLILISRWQ